MLRWWWRIVCLQFFDFSRRHVARIHDRLQWNITRPAGITRMASAIFISQHYLILIFRTVLTAKPTAFNYLSSDTERRLVNSEQIRAVKTPKFLALSLYRLSGNDCSRFSGLASMCFEWTRFIYRLMLWLIQSRQLQVPFLEEILNEKGKREESWHLWEFWRKSCREWFFPVTVSRTTDSILCA